MDVLSALAVGMVPEEFWDTNDDKCDCVYQRIGMWTNPYLGETLEVRMCCIWAELYKLFPQFVRVVPAYLDGNKNEWVEGAAEWNGEVQMPRSIWYRQLARKEGISVAEARARYSDKEPPAGVVRPKEPMKLGPTALLAIENVQQKMALLQGQFAAILQEAGLDPARRYHIAPDGTVTEVEDADTPVSEP